MTTTINLDTEKAKFLKKILEKVFHGRNEFTRPTSDGGREYLTSLEELDRIDEVLVGVIGQLSRGIEGQTEKKLKKPTCRGCGSKDIKRQYRVYWLCENCYKLVKEGIIVMG